jgi:hypothetical protein
MASDAYVTQLGSPVWGNCEGKVRYTRTKRDFQGMLTVAQHWAVSSATYQVRSIRIKGQRRRYENKFLIDKKLTVGGEFT